MTIADAGVENTLEAYHLFSFEGMSDALRGEAVEYVDRLDITRQEANSKVDVIFGSAAEIATQTIATDTIAWSLESPLPVSDAAMMIALTRANCSPTNLVHRVTRFEGALAGVVKLADAFFYTGDLMKCLQIVPSEWVGIELPQLVLGNMEHLVEEFETAFRAGGTRLGKAVAESRSLRLQGAVWTAKLAALVDREGVQNHLDRYVQYFQLTRETTA
jgi:hypothetical protein